MWLLFLLTGGCCCLCMPSCIENLDYTPSNTEKDVVESATIKACESVYDRHMKKM